MLKQNYGDFRDREKKHRIPKGCSKLEDDFARWFNIYNKL